MTLRAFGEIEYIIGYSPADDRRYFEIMLLSCFCVFWLFYFLLQPVIRRERCRSEHAPSTDPVTSVSPLPSPHERGAIDQM